MLKNYLKIAARNLLRNKLYTAVHIGGVAFGTICQTEPAHAQVLIHGFVRDAQTGEGLTAATVQIQHSFSGTIANDDGEYLLQIDSLPATLLVTCIGYQSAEQIIVDSTAGAVDFNLQSVPHVFAQTIVSGEDPAVLIMRQVIERKKRWRSRLKNYQVEVYSRWTVAKREGVVGVVEIASEMYWDGERGLGERVKSRRTTANIQGASLFGEFSAIDLILNFYEDDIEILGHRIMGPTHPQALRHYEFELVGQRRIDDAIVHDIAVHARSPLQPAFAGTLAVLDGEFALLEAVLVPNQAALARPSPGVREFDLAYRQQYRSFGTGMWLPVDFRITINFKFATIGLQFPFMRRDIVQRLSGYKVNIPLPDSLFAHKHIERKNAAEEDSLFAHFRDAVPLSTAERQAYAHIDSSVTLLEAFAPSGFLARFMPPPTRRDSSASAEKALRFKPALRTNRVDAFYLGAEVQRTLSPSLRAALNGGYSAGQERWSYGGGLHSTWGEEGRLALGLSYRADVQERYASHNVSRNFNSLQVLLGGQDYFDYFWNEHLALELGVRSVKRDLLFTLRLNDEKQRSLKKGSRFDLLDHYDEQRLNPSIEKGQLRSVVFAVDHGEAYAPWSLFAHRSLRAQVEYSDEAFGSDFSFAQYQLFADWHIKTLLKRRAPPNALNLRLVAGASTGDLPVQRFGVLDAGVGRFTPFGGLRSLRNLPYEGEQYLGLFWEQYFRTIPFEILGLQPLVSRGVGLVLHGASGRTWIAKEKRAELQYSSVYTGSFHHEVGLSLIFFHFLRLDFTRRLDQADWSVGLSLARLDFAKPGSD